ncbi:MAG: DUF3040 domain-containing protein [Propionibacteriaceae bacterium]|jgi:TRAP-type uncharacterized transport system fused permease subunit|nr:DUF3040 domain-containing protein [Propionibacteriaceae bacterium]
MALTDEEQRLLDLLESSLRSEDPKLAAQFSSAKLKGAPSASPLPSLARLVAAGSICLVGIGMLVVGMIVAWPISVAGFLVMLGAVVFGLHVGKPSVSAPTSGGGASKRTQANSSVKDRMEQRWERRQDKERA